jgi:periplasmic protein TonB
MSIRSPVINTAKKAVRDIPLWLALLTATAAHLLLIFELQIDRAKVEKKTNRLLINIIKVPPRHSAPPSVPVVIPTPSVTPVHQTTAIESPSVPKLEKPAAKLIKTFRSKQVRKHYSPVTPITIAPEPKVVDDSETPASVTELKKTPLPEPIVETKVNPDAVLPVAAIPVIKPDATVMAEPAPAPKAEVVPVVETIEPVISKPAVIEKQVVPIDSPQLPEDIAKLEAVPVKPIKKSGKKSPKQSTSKNNTSPPENPPPLSLDDLATQITQVGEKFGNLPAPEEATESRVKKITSVREHKVSARQYILDWQRKVERMGNLNYPEVARQKDFSAKLVMEVGINSDGSIHSIKIKKPSGTPALDEAAKNIVQMGEPYAALPKNLAQELDVLIIQRTWLFADESVVTQ